MKFEKPLPYDIRISQISSGHYLVQIGCLYRCYDKIIDLKADLTEYLENPDEVVKQYHKSNQCAKDCYPEENTTCETCAVEPVRNR